MVIMMMMIMMMMMMMKTLVPDTPAMKREDIW